MGYSLSQMLFWMLRHLHGWDIRCCRCFFLPVMYNCIFNLPISWLADTHFRKIASVICLFYDLRMLPLQKQHPQFTYSISWRCFRSKINILNLLISQLADASPQFLPNCVLWNIKLLTLHNLIFMIWYHYIFREFLFSEFSKPQGSHLGFRFLKHNPIWKEVLLTNW